MKRLIRPLTLILAILIAFTIFPNPQPLRAEDVQDAPPPTEEELPTQDTVVLNGVEIWSGEVPQDSFVPLTPIAWALGYYIQEKPTGEFQIYIVAPGELSDNPLDDTVFITMDPSYLDAYGAPAVIELGEGFYKDFEIVPFHAPPVLQDGELYLDVNDVLTIFEAEITIEDRVINIESKDFNSYIGEHWIPQGYTLDQWIEVQEYYRDEEGVPIATFYEPINNPEILYTKLSDFATLTQGEGLEKPETIEDKLNTVAQVVANSDPESGITEIDMEELLIHTDFFFGPGNYDLDELPETWPIPESKAKIEIHDAEYETEDNLNYTITYVNPANGATETANVHIAINWRSDFRPVFLAFDEITVIED